MKLEKNDASRTSNIFLWFASYKILYLSDYHRWANFVDKDNRKYYVKDDHTPIGIKQV